MTDLTAAQIVEQLRGFSANREHTTHQAAALIEQQSARIEAYGKRLALADAAPHGDRCDLYRLESACTCWKAAYDAAKEGRSASEGKKREPMLGGLPEPDHDDMACYMGPCICAKEPLS